MTTNSLYVLRTHVWNKSIGRLWSSLCQDLGADRVWVLYDTTSTPVDAHQLPEVKQIICTSESECKQANRVHKNCYETVETQLVLFDSKLPKEVTYSYLWLIEYDVRCSGKWSLILGNVDMLWQADFMAWGRVGDDTLATGCFFPVTRISRHMIHRLRDDCLNKRTGFCETFFPQLCSENIGLRARALPPAMFAAEFRYRPRMSESYYNQMIDDEFGPQGQARTLLYHPVIDDQTAVDLFEDFVRQKSHNHTSDAGPHVGSTGPTSLCLERPLFGLQFVAGAALALFFLNKLLR